MRSIILFSFLLLSDLLLSQKQKCGNLEPGTCSNPSIEVKREFDFDNSGEPGTLQFRDQITIPLVFHVFNIEGDNFQIGEDEIFNMLANLNLHFNNLNSGLGRVPERFKNFIGNPNIRFCIGYREENGEIEEGIIFKTTNINNFLDQLVENDKRRHKIKYSDYGGDDPWNTDHYINIWVSGSEAFDGKSVPPYISGIVEEEDGILLDYRQFKSDNNAFILVHELGHYFYLLHIWGNEDKDCVEDDGIEDTPQQFTSHFGCPSGDEYSCGSYDMFMNYMDYTDQECSLMFTKGQIVAMYAAINKYWSGLLNANSLCKKEDKYKIISNITISKSLTDLSICKGIYGEREINIEIFDIKGRLIDKSKINPLEYCYSKDILRFSSGIYFVRLIDEDMVEIRKIFIFGNKKN